MSKTTILHYSDTHEHDRPVQVVFNFFKEKKFDFIVGSGDLVKRQFEDDYVINPQGYPIVLGNHDVARGQNWYSVASDSELVNKFRLNLNPLNVVRKDSATWWYKDVNDITIIGLNCCKLYGSYNDEKEWLIEQLNRCIKGGRPVVLFSHIFDASTPYKKIACSFTHQDYINAGWLEANRNKGFLKSYPAICDFDDIVTDYVLNKNLNVVFWGHGHEHSDAYITKSNGKIRHFIVGSGRSDQYNDLKRDPNMGDTSCIVTNLYEIDTTNNILTVYRFGADDSFKGGHRKKIVIDMKTSDVIRDY